MGEVVSPNRRYIHVGNLNMQLTGRWFPQIVRLFKCYLLLYYILCFYCMEIENKYMSIYVFNIFMLYFSV